MTDVSEQSSATNEPLATDAASQLTKANKYAFSLLAGSQNVLLDEMMFAGNEFLERAIAETRIFNEFISKLAEAHSVKDLGQDVPGVHQASAGLHPPRYGAALETQRTSDRQHLETCRNLAAELNALLRLVVLGRSNLSTILDRSGALDPDVHRLTSPARYTPGSF